MKYNIIEEFGLSEFVMSDKPYIVSDENVDEKEVRKMINTEIEANELIRMKSDQICAGYNFE